MSRNKYVIVEPAPGLPVAILAPEIVLHKQAIDRSLLKPVSAGFFSLVNGYVCVFGESTSLCLRARTEDAKIICDTLCSMGLAQLPEPSTRSSQLSTF